MKNKLINLTALALLIGSQGVLAQRAAVSTSDVVGQGDAGSVVAADGARLVRSKNGLSASISMPTPIPHTYTYPTGNVFQPIVLAGSPEAYSAWIFIFNNPAECSDGICDGDDIGSTPARGGVYNLAGHIVGSGLNLTLSGHISVGEATFGGAPLDNPSGAEVHVAIAPHGKLQPELLPTQITTPLGDPNYWWVAFFTL